MEAVYVYLQILAIFLVEHLKFLFGIDDRLGAGGSI